MMAVPEWLRLLMYLLHTILTFFLQPTSVGPLPQSLTCLSNAPEGEPGLVDQLLAGVTSLLGLDLPRDISLFNYLPRATAFLLRLTEVVHPEVLLFLVMLGTLCLFCCMIGLFLGLIKGICRAGRWSMGLAVRAVGAAPVTPISMPDPTPLPNPRAPRPLSDTARTLAPAIEAHNVCSSPRPRRQRRRA